MLNRVLESLCKLLLDRDKADLAQDHIDAIPLGLPIQRAISHFQLHLLYSARARKSVWGWLLRFQAMRHLTSAMVASKDYPTPHIRYALLLAQRGYLKESLDLLNQAIPLQMKWIEVMCGESDLGDLNADSQRLDLASILACKGLYSWQLGAPNQALVALQEARSVFQCLAVKTRIENGQLERRIEMGIVSSLLFLRRFAEAYEFSGRVMEDYPFKDYVPDWFGFLSWLQGALPGLIAFSEQFPQKELPMPFVQELMERTWGCKAVAEVREVRRTLLDSSQTSNVNRDLLSLADYIKHQLSERRNDIEARRKQVPKTKVPEFPALPRGVYPEDSSTARLFGELERANRVMEDFLDIFTADAISELEVSTERVDELSSQATSIAWKDSLRWWMLEVGRFGLYVIVIVLLIGGLLNDALSPGPDVVGTQRMRVVFGVAAALAAVQYGLQSRVDRFLLGTYKRLVALSIASIANGLWSRYNILLRIAGELRGTQSPTASSSPATPVPLSASHLEQSPDDPESTTSAVN